MLHGNFSSASAWLYIWVRGTRGDPWPCCLWHLSVNYLHFPKHVDSASRSAEVCSLCVSLPSTLALLCSQHWLYTSLIKILLMEITWPARILDIPEWHYGVMTHWEQRFNDWTGTCLWSVWWREMPHTHLTLTPQPFFYALIHQHYFVFFKMEVETFITFYLSCVRVKTSHLLDWGFVLLPPWFIQTSLPI